MSQTVYNKLINNPNLFETILKNGELEKLIKVHENKEKLNHLVQLRSELIDTDYILDVLNIQKLNHTIDKVIDYYQRSEIEHVKERKTLMPVYMNVFNYDREKVYFAPLHDFLSVVPNNIKDLQSYKFAYYNMNSEAYKNALYMVSKIDKFTCEKTEYYVCEDNYFYMFDKANNLVRAIYKGQLQKWQEA
jgi:hypothetical protein